MQTFFDKTIARSERSLQREIDEAQVRRNYRIDGLSRERVPHAGSSCGDCGAADGEYHVPGCENEVCPACGGRVISCDCAYGPSLGLSILS